MELPNKNRAVVDLEKVRDYLLNEAHPDGYGKAEFFATRGFRREAWQVLADGLKQMVIANAVTKSMTSLHGQRSIL
jgi:hypothetical protein